MPDRLQRFIEKSPHIKGYVKNSTVKWLVAATFALSSLLNIGGLKLVQDYAADQAAKKATALAIVTAEATRYNANRTTCGFRGLIDPGVVTIKSDIKKAEADIKTYEKALKDKSLSPGAIQRTKDRLASTKEALTASQESLINARKFRAIYSTVPPGYDCKDLPKDPPPLTSPGGYTK